MTVYTFLFFHIEKLTQLLLYFKIDVI